MRASPLPPLALSLLGLLTPAGPARAAGGPAIHSGSSMVYLANSSPPGFRLQWVSPFFDDSSWTPGVYGVGYESNPPGATGLIGTPVPAGTFSVFTRARFTIDDPRAISSIFLGADYDDGYVAWINGVEVARSKEMPAGALAWNTAAALHESSNGQAPSYGALQNISAAGIPALHDGVNVLAVGVWNAAITSSDLVLVPRLSMDVTASVTRGPYLQLATPSSMVVRWRTGTATDGQVRYGLAPG